MPVVVKDDFEGINTTKEGATGSVGGSLRGVDVAPPHAPNASVRAPGVAPGRLMVISETALKTIGAWTR